MLRIVPIAVVLAGFLGLACCSPARGQSDRLWQTAPQSQDSASPRFDAADFLAGPGESQALPQPEVPSHPHANRQAGRPGTPWARNNTSTTSSNNSLATTDSREMPPTPRERDALHPTSAASNTNTASNAVRLPIQPAAYQNETGLTSAGRPSLSPRRLSDAKLARDNNDSPHADNPGKPAGLDPARSLVTSGSALAIALGAFFVLLWGWRKRLPQANHKLPGGVLEVLGRSTLDGKHRLHLVKLGGKLLLVSTTAAGAETLAEIDDPDEVTRLIGLCLESRPGSSTRAFREMVAELSQERNNGLRRGKPLISGGNRTGDERSNLQAALRRVREDAHG